MTRGNSFMEWILSIIGPLLISLIVTLLFNKLVGLPKKLKESKEAERKQQETLMKKVEEQEVQIETLKQQQMNQKTEQEELKKVDQNILALCSEIREDILQNRAEVLDKLNHLERREKNSIRAKILMEYRLYTDNIKNPLQAWSEMEHHSFFKLVEDYESLGGNDYVHSTILPAMNELDVVPMDNLKRLKELYDSRKA